MDRQKNLLLDFPYMLCDRLFSDMYL
jgi:hypothetical protein